MSLPDNLALRDATLADLPGIGELRVAAGWTVREWALRAVIGQSHARCVLAVETDGSVVGVGSGIAYRPIGFVGNMVVAEGHRRMGIGSAVLNAITDFLAAGCPRLELYATAEGRPLYERHGFETIGTSVTARIERERGLSADPSVDVRRATVTDLAAIARYDRPRFGGDRQSLLRMLLTDPASPFVLASRDDNLVGYACVRPKAPRVGPLLADEPSVAEALLVEAFAMAPADELRLNLPPNNRSGAAWLRGLGIEVEPWDGRMARGPRVPRRDETVYGMAVGALG